MFYEIDCPTTRCHDETSTRSEPAVPFTPKAMTTSYPLNLISVRREPRLGKAGKPIFHSWDCKLLRRTLKASECLRSSRLTCASNVVDKECTSTLVEAQRRATAPILIGCRDVIHEGPAPSVRGRCPLLEQEFTWALRRSKPMIVDTVFQRSQHFPEFSGSVFSLLRERRDLIFWGD